MSVTDPTSILEQIRTKVVAYQTRLAEAQGEHVRLVRQSETALAAESAEAASALASSLAELLGDQVGQQVTSTVAAPEPAAQPRPEEPAGDHRSELKAECMRIERELAALPGGEREVRQAKADCGLDPERPTGASKCKAAAFGDYRSELLRRLGLLRRPAVQPAAEPAREESPSVAVGAQSSMEGLF